MRKPHSWFFREALAQLPTDLCWAPTLTQKLGHDTAEVVVGLDAPLPAACTTRARTTMRIKWAVAEPPAGPVSLELPGDC
jgi:hypothetical protein